MSKHSSTWETLALTLFFPPLAYVAKKELLSIPFFGWGFALASPITIDRKAGTDAMQQIATQGRERFAQGFWIVVYPEGTRIRAGTRAKYKTGGARLAIELGVPILPVAHNAGYLWPKGLFGKRPGTVDDLVRHADLAGRQGRADAHDGSRDMDRKRSRAARHPGVSECIARLRLDEPRRPRGRGRRPGAPHRARRRQRRLSAGARAAPLDRHAGRRLRASRCARRAGSRSARSTTLCRARARGSCARSTSGGAPARRAAARMEVRRPDPLSGARARRWRSHPARADARSRPTSST